MMNGVLTRLRYKFNSHPLIFRDGSVLLLVLLIGAGLMFGFHGILARLLGPSEYGVFAYMNNTVEFVLPIVILGLPNVLIRFVSVYTVSQEWALLRGLLRSTWIGIITASILGGMGIWGFYQLGLTHSITLGGWGVVAGAALVPVIALLDYEQSVLRGLKNPVGSSIPNQIVRPVVAVSLLVVIWLFTDLNASSGLVVFLISASVSVAITHFIRQKHMPLGVTDYQAIRADYTPLKAWFGMGKNLILIGIATQFLHRSSIFLLGALASPEQIGLFAVGFQVSKLIGIAMESASAITNPIVAEAVHKGDKTGLQKIFSESLVWLALISLPLGVVIILGGHLILAAFGPTYQKGYAVFVTLTITNLTTALSGPLRATLNMSGNEGWLLVILLTGGAVTLSTGLVLIPSYSALGAAFARLLGILVVNVFSFFILHQKYGLKLRFKTTSETDND